MVRCEVCGRGEASYVCRACGSRVCVNCFDPASWTCARCFSLAQRSRAKPRASLEAPPKLPRLLFIAGLASIILGFALMALLPFMTTEGSVAGGGLIIVGPIPVAFGCGEGWPILLGVAIALALLLAFLAFKLLS